MFTDRFIKVPIELIDRKLYEITDDDTNFDNRETYAKINPFEISHYHPQPDNNDQLNVVTVYFKNGESLLIETTIKDFENLLNLHGEN